MSLLQIKDLHIDLKTRNGELNLVQDINIEIRKGETFGIVGESGCGKSLTANSIMGLLPNPPLNVREGEILFKGKDLLKTTEKEKRSIRGNEISMIFQEPMTALDPLFTIGEQMREAILIHDKSISKEELSKRVIDALKSVGIPRPEKIIS
jgi:ABC-type dipeptide/oligopeptide/nickel transport system ATPase component